MFKTPVDAAALVYGEALTSLMAHTIRGIKKLFARELLDLDVKLIPDLGDRIGLLKGHDAPPSILQTRHFDGPWMQSRGRVTANIYIHRHANKHLARLCIAHEVYHLILELRAYAASSEKHNERVWPTAERILNPEDKAMTDDERSLAIKSFEDDCDVFAWELCRRHDKFNRDDNARDKHVYFPKRTFVETLKTSRLRLQQDWPDGIALDPTRPFWKRDWVST